MLRHPADGSQWRAIDREFPDFADDARNLRFALSTDGMNPFDEQRSSHSTWPVTLCIYNLPPWLCMKRKFIMMPVLIQGPKQPRGSLLCMKRKFIMHVFPAALPHAARARLPGREGGRWKKEDEEKKEEVCWPLPLVVHLSHRLLFVVSLSTHMPQLGISPLL